MLFPPMTLVRKTMASYNSLGHDWTGRKDLLQDIVHSYNTVVFEQTARICRKCLQSEKILCESNEPFCSFMCFTFQMFFSKINFLALSPPPPPSRPVPVTYHYTSSKLAGWHAVFGADFEQAESPSGIVQKMFPKHEWPLKRSGLWE